MSSKWQIANRALRRLAVAAVQSPSESTEQRRAVDDVWQAAVDEVLAEHPWNCALVRTTLAADGTAPAWGFARAFSLPSDPFCLRVWRLSEEHHPRAKFEVKGRKIHTDEAAPLRVELIVRLADPEQLAPHVARCISAKIAEELAYKLTNSREKEEQMADWYEGSLRKARSLDAQEGTPEDVAVDEFLSERY
jgi:hypothetical protein